MDEGASFDHWHFASIASIKEDVSSSSVSYYKSSCKGEASKVPPSARQNADWSNIVQMFRRSQLLGEQEGNGRGVPGRQLSMLSSCFYIFSASYSTSDFMVH